MSQLLPEPTAESGMQETLSVSRIERLNDRRRMVESAVLALIALTGVWWLRSSFESAYWCAAEIVSIVTFAGLLATTSRNRNRVGFCVALLVTPLVFAVVARQFNAPIPYEMTAISMLGVGSLALALYVQTRRNLALSVVTSGFLILFSTLISDDLATLIPALIWITLCMWHLVANHWERVTSCTPDDVRRSISVRPAAVVVGLGLFVLGGWAIHGRASQPQRLSLGIMPTSGGSIWSDPAARSGVGSGDAAVAAKDHAESFGAVESALFLESTQSSLYDMFSDSFGEPKLKPKWERRQGMASEKLIEAHQHTAKSERGGESFSTSRHKPTPQQHLGDANEQAVLQWIGPVGIRLAMNRYDAFDGVDWFLQTSWKKDHFSRVDLGDEAWFVDPTQASKVAANPKILDHGGVLKVIRLNTTRIPSPMMTAAVHIKDVDRPDFFGIDHDGSFCMPGRQKIPALTVLHLAVTSMMEDDLLDPGSLADRQAHLGMLASLPESRRLNERPDVNPAELASSAGQLMAGALARELTAEETNPYRKLQAIVGHLRNSYTFDRQSVAEGADPLQQFLTNRRGGDHLFATAAAVMARSIGLNSRLASGFYVRPGAFDIGQGHASVVPEDVHVWAEVELEDGRWIEIEPTPGYRPPDYKPSAWLLTKRYAATYWPQALGLGAIGTLIFLTRLFWIELFIHLAWLMGGKLSDRRRVRFLLWILQCRASLAGKPRRAGMPQRDWLLSLTRRDDKLAAGAVECCDAADQMVFGGRLAGDWSEPANLLVHQITTRYISQGSLEETSQPGVHV